MLWFQLTRMLAFELRVVTTNLLDVLTREIANGVYKDTYSRWFSKSLRLVHYLELGPVQGVVVGGIPPLVENSKALIEPPLLAIIWN